MTHFAGEQSRTHLIVLWQHIELDRIRGGGINCGLQGLYRPFSWTFPEKKPSVRRSFQNLGEAEAHPAPSPVSAAYGSKIRQRSGREEMRRSTERIARLSCPKRSRLVAISVKSLVERCYANAQPKFLFSEWELDSDRKSSVSEICRSSACHSLSSTKSRRYNIEEASAVAYGGSGLAFSSLQRVDWTARVTFVADGWDFRRRSLSWSTTRVWSSQTTNSWSKIGNEDIDRRFLSLRGTCSRRSISSDRFVSPSGRVLEDYVWRRVATS